MSPPDLLSTAVQYHQAGNFAAAGPLYRQLLAEQPAQPQLHFLFGLLSYQLGHNDVAVQHLRQAAALAPAEPVYHSGLGLVYRGLKLFPQSIASYRRALAINPTNAADYYDLGLAYMQQEELAPAADCFEQALKLEPAQLFWRLELDGLCPAVMPSAAAITDWRANFARALEKYPPGSVNLSEWLAGGAPINVYPPFNLPYHGHNDLPLKSRYAQIFSVDAPPPRPTPTPPYRVGFLVTRTHERIFLSLMGGLLNHWADPELEPVIVAPPPSLERLRAGITNPRVSYRPILEELPLAVAALRANPLDLLYYWEAGSDALNYFLPFFRPAPVQCTSWGLSSTSGIPQMDYFISSTLLEPDGAEAHYSERLVKLNTLPTCFARPELPNPLRPRSYFGLPEQAHIYFCPQNLLKIHPDFDAIMAEILRRDPQGLVLLLETKTPRWKDDLQQRFRQSIPDVAGRIRFAPRQEFADFMNLLAVADVLLDTVHYSGGNTAHEALATGTPLVTLPGPYLRGRLTLGRYRQMGLLDCVAASPQEYVDIAVRLGTNPACRAEIKAKILAANAVLYDDRQAVQEMADFFKKAIRRAGAAPAGGRLKKIKFDGQSAPASWPSVSLCMIVKNEAATLAECLRSVGDLAGEAIVVDTGSSDDTAAIARSLGARVIHFDWVDDFAAARNESIRHATGDWIFWMDADDRLSATDRTRLKQALVSGQADVYAANIVSGEPGDRLKTVGQHLRLFRNRRGLRFIYPIHETLDLSAGGVTVADTNISITHTGYAVDEAGLKAKARRNLAIVRRALERDPGNLHWQHHLGISLHVLGQYAEAAEALAAVIANPPPTLSREVDVYQAHLSLVAAYIKTGRRADAENVLRQALQTYPHRQHLAVAAGMFYLDNDDPAAALRHFEQAAALPDAAGEVGYAWSPEVLPVNLSLAHLLLTDRPRAAAALQPWLAKIDPLPFDEAAAGRDFRAGRWADFTHRLVGVTVTRPDLLRQLAHAHRQLQQWDDALAALAQALALAAPQPGEWRALAALYLLKTGQAVTARRLLEWAASHEPADPLTPRLLRFLVGNLWAQVTALGQRCLANPDDRAARQWLAELAACFELTPAALVGVQGRRLLGEKEFALAAQLFSYLIEERPTNPEPYRLLAVALNGLGYKDDAVTAWQAAQQLSAAERG